MSGSAALAARVAAARLGDGERLALELRDGDGAGYAQIAERLGVEPRAVAALLVSARLHVRESLRGSVPDIASPACERARPLLAARQDGEPLAADDREWLREHVAGCESCPATRVALREGTIALRAALGSVRAVAPAAPRRPAPVPAGPAAARPRTRSRRRAPALLAGAVAAAFVGSLAAIVTGGDGPRTSAAGRAPAAATATPAPTATATATPAARRRAASAKRKRARRPRPPAAASPTLQPTATAAPVRTAVPQPTAAPPAAEKPKQRPRRRPPADDGDQQVTSGKGGAGLPKPVGTPDPADPNTVIPDACTEDNPDCESG